jgi:4-diphosphocytidyl-2-C-methyl-D-erythritol kinase
MNDRSADMTSSDIERPATDAGLFDFAHAEFALTEFAPAKVNLALHAVGQRADGYHLLDSIVTFTADAGDATAGAPAGDRLGFGLAKKDAFSISGRFGEGLSPDPGAAQRNLVLKARDMLRVALQARGLAAPPVAIHLQKNLPIASGIGGGSADAAATLRGLLRLWDAQIGERQLSELALSLGADVPMCLKSRPLAARGIGEDITMLDSMPSFAIVLGNPLFGVSTPDIFRRLTSKNNPAIPPLTGDWQADLGMLRNDLEPPARFLVKEIGELSDMMAAEGAWLARMSGSGATCFGLFDTLADATTAASNLQRKRPDWYFSAAQTIGDG